MTSDKPLASDSVPCSCINALLSTIRHRALSLTHDGRIGFTAVEAMACGSQSYGLSTCHCEATNGIGKAVPQGNTEALVKAMTELASIQTSERDRTTGFGLCKGTFTVVECLDTV